MTLFDHNHDGRPDPTIGAPGENEDSGMITTLPGSKKRFSTSQGRRSEPAVRVRRCGGVDQSVSWRCCVNSPLGPEVAAEKPHFMHDTCEARTVALGNPK